MEWLAAGQPENDPRQQHGASAGTSTSTSMYSTAASRQRVADTSRCGATKIMLPESNRRAISPGQWAEVRIRHSDGPFASSAGILGKCLLGLAV